jgi:type II secretory pathway pseudopilin PulG
MHPHAQHGYTYLTLLFAVAFMGAGLGAVSSLWHTAQMREKERQLLYVGDQYRKAIEAYYRQGKQYPRELVQLLRDHRVPGVRRYLRKPYRDPITNKSEWGLVKAPDGGIAGVYSLSEQAPFKQAEFPKEYATFAGKGKYSDWKFAYLPTGTPGGAPGAPSPQQGMPGAAPSPQQGMPGAPGPAAPGAAAGAGAQGPVSPGSAPPQTGAGAGGASPFGTPSGGSTQAPPSGLGGASQPAAPRP